jgi:hypothetical protein
MAVAPASCAGPSLSAVEILVFDMFGAAAPMLMLLIAEVKIRSSFQALSGSIVTVGKKIHHFCPA